MAPRQFTLGVYDRYVTMSTRIYGGSARKLLYCRGSAAAISAAVRRRPDDGLLDVHESMMLVASYTYTSLHIYKCKHNISHVTGTTVIVSVEAVVETPVVVYAAAVAAYASVLSYRSEASRSSSRCFSGLREIGEIAD